MFPFSSRTALDAPCVVRHLWAWALLLAGASALAAPPPISAFFGNEEMSQPVLSPSGKHLAVRTATSNGRLQLAVINLDPPRQSRLVAGYADADIGSVQWVNDDRLVYNITDSEYGFDRSFVPGLFAVDRTGENRRELVQRYVGDVQTTGTHIASRLLGPRHALLRTLRDGSSDVIVQRYEFDVRGDWEGSVPLRLDTTDGRARPLDTGLNGLFRHWLIDNQGVAHMATSSGGGRSRVQWRPAGDQPWKVVAEGAQYGAGTPFTPFALGAAGEVYALEQRADAERTTALYRFDPKAQKLEAEPVLGLQGFDVDQAWLVRDERQRRLLGIGFVSDAAGIAWFDATLKAIQARVDKQLPSTINLIQVPECNCGRWLVVTAFSDRQPPIFALYDRENDKLEVLGQARKAIDPRQMAGREFTRFAARDGLSIPLHVTKPEGKGPWPTVVLVHGGPYLRGGHWQWSAEAQFLASRGYLVLAPEFRGSTGYGGRLYRAGWKQWGLAMQDDLADATRWAIRQGLADPKRVCIAGASYGGYATLMGLIKHPELYRCGVAWAAVVDIGLMASLDWSDLSEDWKSHGIPAMVADPAKDAEQIAATSPLKQAARLRQPLLLAHGGNDLRVPADHFRQMRSALKAHNDQVEAVEYELEGHGWFKPENRFDFYGRMERFLEKHLKPAP